MSTGGVGHTHRFDPVSGWCAFCNLRDDNKLIGKGGDILRPGREYSPEELEQIRQKASAR
jgi:hypothetical protein